MKPTPRALAPEDRYDANIDHILRSAAAVFAAGLAIAGAVSFYAMSAISEQSHTEQMSASIKEGLETLKDVRSRMGVYANFLSRHPDDPFAVNHLLTVVLFRELYRMGGLNTGE